MTLLSQGLPLILALVGHDAADRPVPSEVTVATARGELRFPVTTVHPAGQVIPGDPLLNLLGATSKQSEVWLEVSLARQSFRFLLGAPVMTFNDRVEPLSGSAIRVRDSLFLPLQFLTEILPQVLAERYRWDPRQARLVELGVHQAPPPVAVRRLANGLLPGHVVVIDPGHGGRDNGNPGIYFPRGVTEKDINLQVSLLLRDELKRRGVKPVMTRTTDTLIALLDRAGYCTRECDLFVSMHVNSLERRRGPNTPRGLELFILGEENTEDADRVARMENEALRFEGIDPAAATGGLDFILRDLQMNEYLRESARAAQLVEESVVPVHTGGSRGVKQTNRLAVLNTARRPAVLVEMGFSTNPSDARLLSGRKSQVSLAYAIADAIVAYLLEFERKTAGANAPGGGQ